jgi:16S rRNA (guanine527-N7)-methyltransferase
LPSLDDRSCLIDQLMFMLRLEWNIEQKIKLQRYVQLLMEGLKKQRLTGEKTREGLVFKQIYDCIYPLQLLDFRDGVKTVDLGSGAGLPGIPIKILQPDLQMYLLEANKRKAEFLAMASEKLKLENVFILHGRAEEFANSIQHREQYAQLVCKAVASIAVLVEIALPLLKIGGVALFYKGPQGYEEARLAGKALQICGGQIANDFSYQLPTGEKRTLFLVEKTDHTPPEYPRAPGKPQKKPLL